MTAHEYPYLEKPEKLEFPTETWAAQDIRKSDVLHHAGLHAAGEERSKFLERAKFFYQTSTQTLSRMPTKALARPVIVLLTSGLMQGWQERHQAEQEQLDGRWDFGSPRQFVPQRVRAFKRAKAIGAGLLAVAAVAILAWFFRS